VIPHSRPWLCSADLDAVAAVLRSELINQSSTTANFEAAFSRWLGLDEPGVALASGAAALQVALVALGVHAGDEVILPTYVCRSVLDAVRAAGAAPRLADVGPEWVLTPSNAAPLVGARTRAIVVPHMYGIFADVASFRTFGVPIIEDCAQAVDRPERWRMAGDVGVFSFHPTKCLTTGEGGLAISRDPSMNRRLRTVRDEGGDTARVLAPLSNVAAALGLSQLARYDASLARRRVIAAEYRAALGPAAGMLLRRTPWNRTMHFRFVMSAEQGFDAGAASFARRGVTVRRGVDELLHRIVGESDRAYPMSTELFETTISIPIYPALSDSEIATCSDALAVWASSSVGRNAARSAAAKKSQADRRAYQSTTM
jgi:perosamine synthetase